jgi:hypothetical protein
MASHPCGRRGRLPVPATLRGSTTSGVPPSPPCGPVRGSRGLPSRISAPGCAARKRRRRSLPPSPPRRQTAPTGANASVPWILHRHRQPVSREPMTHGRLSCSHPSTGTEGIPPPSGNAPPDDPPVPSGPGLPRRAHPPTSRGREEPVPRSTRRSSPAETVGGKGGERAAVPTSTSTSQQGSRNRVSSSGYLDRPSSLRRSPCAHASEPLSLLPHA